MTVQLIQPMASTFGNGIVVRITAERLELCSRDGCVLLSWPLRSECRGGTIDAQEAPVTCRTDDEVIHLEFDSRSAVHEELRLFPDARIAATQWRTVVLNGHNRVWDAGDNAAIEVMSCNEVRGEVRSNWFANVPARVAAFDLDESGWLAVSIPGALSVARTRFHFHDGAFDLTFREYRPTDAVGPLRVCLRAGLHSPGDALAFHAEMTRKLGYWRDRSNHPRWWSLPRWGMYDENCHTGQTSLDAPDARNSPLTPDRIRGWTQQVRQITGLNEFFVFYDQGYFRRYGEYVPVDSLGGVEGFRRLIDAMRRDGVRTGLYCHPFHADLAIPEIAAHPDWLVLGDDPSAPPVSGDMRLGSLDWTHPQVTSYMRGVIRRIVSPEPGCLNADWLMVNNNHVPDPLKCRFHDRDWGIGDRMAYKARRAIYLFAKEFKPDVVVSFIGLDPVLQETADLFWVNESWGETCDNWHHMAHAVTQCLPGSLVAINPYILSHGKHAEYVSVMPAYSVPAAMPLNFIHAHGHSKEWQPMTRENLRRWGASWQVYMNAPMTADQPRYVELTGDRLVAWRRHASGPLAGFYAGLALGRRGTVTYSETQALAMAMDYMLAEIPLPPAAVFRRVEAIASDGSATVVPASCIQHNGERFVRVELWDSGGGQTGQDDVYYYRVAYQLNGGGKS